MLKALLLRKSLQSPQPRSVSSFLDGLSEGFHERVWYDERPGHTDGKEAIDS